MARRDHRRPASHRLDHDEAERLLPLDREERRARVLEELDLLAVRHLAEELDPAVAEMRLDKLREVLPLLLLAVLAREPQRKAELHRDGDRPVRSLVGTEPAEEEEVLARVRLARIEREVDGIRNRRHPREIGHRLALVLGDGDETDPRRHLGDVAVDSLGVVDIERAVDGMQDRRLDEPPEGRARHPGVVVDHVELVRTRIAGERVPQLGQSSTEQLARRPLENVREVGLRQRVARREERHIVACVDEPARQQRDDELDAPVTGRRHREPGRRQDRDLQLVHAVSLNAGGSTGHSRSSTRTLASSIRTSQTRSKARIPDSLSAPAQVGSSSGRIVRRWCCLRSGWMPSMS